jgi:hypothetical protein
MSGPPTRNSDGLAALSGEGKRGEGRGDCGLLIGAERGRITQGVKRMKRGK